MKWIGKIALIVLASFYLMTTSAISVRVISEGIPCSGANAIDTWSGKSAEIPAKLTSQRGHVSLAKAIPCPSPHVNAAIVPPVVDEQRTVIELPVIGNSRAFFSLSLCDRAPPLA
ncbi:MAG: hypothetical protein HY961_04375 [Ignavibacteriae bacterium]|nr:hypothetical protein [Ignavibacteriota bacterium]